MSDILLLLDSSGIGGIESHVATLSLALERAGHRARVVLLARHGDNPFEAQLAAQGRRFEALDGRFRSLVARFAGGDVGLVHTHGYKAGVLGRLAARLVGVPVVSSFHAGERGAFPVGLYQRLDEWTAFLGGRIAVSRPIAAKLPFAARIVPNFVAMPPMTAPRSGRARIGFVGRLSPEKGPDRFVGLAARFSGLAEFHVFGDGPLRAGLSASSVAGLTFHGTCTDPERIWSSIDALVLPSRAEGLPMAALEAISRGVPVFATDVGDVAQITRDGRAGELVPAGTDESVVAALEAALRGWLSLSAADRRALALSARAHAAETFGPEAGVAAILAAYRAAGYAA